MKLGKRCFMIFIAAAFLLSGCKSYDYAEAIEALKNESYGTAYGLFIKLGDYKDSQERLPEALLGLATYYAMHGDENNARALLASHPNIENYTEVENIITYYTAIDYFKNNSQEDFSKGIELLSKLPDDYDPDYKSVGELKKEYNCLKDSPLIGRWKTYNSYEPVTGFTYTVELNIAMVYKYKTFWLDVEEKVFSGNQLMTTVNHSILPDNVNGEETVLNPNSTHKREFRASKNTLLEHAYYDWFYVTTYYDKIS